MKRFIIIIFTLIVCSSTNALGEDKKNSCGVLLGAAVYNQFLETNCGFNGKVSDYSKWIYTNAGCGNVLLPNEVNTIVKQITEDSKQKFNSQGKKNFCNSNKMQYNDLANSISKKMPKTIKEKK
jgi:hypothetical protein